MQFLFVKMVQYITVENHKKQENVKQKSVLFPKEENIEKQIYLGKTNELYMYILYNLLFQ